MLYKTKYSRVLKTQWISFRNQKSIKNGIKHTYLQTDHAGTEGKKRTVIANLKNLVQEKIETGKGFRYKFGGSDKTIDLLTSFIKTERLCCDFFTFDLSVGNEESSAWLELSGPEGTKEFIKTEIDL